MSATFRTFEVHRATRASRVGGLASLVVVVFLATLPLWAEAGTLREIDEIAC